MKTLQELAIETSVSKVDLPSGKTAHIQSWTVRFPAADPPRLPDRALKSTYTSKPLVEVDGERVFGELAVVRWLARDGWRGLWADTFHGRKFWRNMPHRAEPVEPPAPVRQLCDRIAAQKGGPSGCFDVVAWKGDRIIWLEYKGAGDRPNRNEKLWIDAAVSAGVSEEDLFFIGDAGR